jgi:cytochrome b involved in lipid metabolism
MAYDQALRGGKAFCTLDDLILDISEYMSRHPAGTFLLKNCIGRDMGKFFYGGYRMEHNEENI